MDTQLRLPEEEPPAIASAHTSSISAVSIGVGR